MNLADREPPHDLNAERSVIGAAMMDNAALPELAAVLPDPGMFYREAHAAMWQAVLGLYRAGEAVDFVTVDHALTRDGGLRKVAGLEYLIEVRECVNHALDAVRHARIVADLAALRDAIEAFQEGIRDCYWNRDDAPAVLGRAIDRLRGAEVKASPETSLRAGELVPGVMDRIRGRRNGDVTGLSTGFADFDATTGFLQAEDLVLVAARPSMGKTSFAMNVAEYAAVTMKCPTLVLSLEMGNPALLERMLSCRSGVPLGRIRGNCQLTRSEEARLADAAADVAAAPLYLLRRASRSVSEVCNEVRRHRARHGIELAVVDYVQLMHSDNPKDSEVQALTKISAALKGVARDAGVPVVALSQLNRNNEGRTAAERRPRLADLRGSGALEQDADVVLFLHRPEYYDPADRPGLAEGIVAKNRNGPVGEFNLSFDKTLTKFSDYAEPVTTRPEDAPF